MPETAFVPTLAVPETNYKRLHRKQVLQHGLTLLTSWMHGHSEKEIAEEIGIGIVEGDVRRDLEWTLALIKRRESSWRGERPPEKAPVVDQMPATLCSQCEAAIAAGAYRVMVVAASRDREAEGDVVETTRALTFCSHCTMNMSGFTIVNDFKLDAEKRAEWAARSAVPGTDALDSWRVNTGHGEVPNGAKEAGDCGPERDPEDERIGRADAEAIELSDHNPQALPEDVAPTQPRPAKEITRERIGVFLKDPRSRGKLRPLTRKIAQLYVDGLTQCEIASRTGVDQSGVSRGIQAATKLACAV